MPYLLGFGYESACMVRVMDDVSLPVIPMHREGSES